MHSEPLLTAVPPTPVQSLAELYAVAFKLAQTAAQRYSALAERNDEGFGPVRRGGGDEDAGFPGAKASDPVGGGDLARPALFGFGDDP